MDSSEVDCEFDVRLAARGDLEMLSEQLGGRHRQIFNHNEAIGSSCYIAIGEQGIMGFLWANQQVIDLSGMRLAALPPRHAFTHNAFVLPEHRGKKVYPLLRRAVCHEMFHSGCVSVGCLVDKANNRAIEILRREGMTFHNAGILKLPVLKPIVFSRVLG